MAEKQEDNGLNRLKAQLREKTLGCCYIFCGEESYLREYYLGQLRKLLVPAGFEEFNCHRLTGKGLAVQQLAEVLEGMPVMAERTLVTVTDWDIFKLPEEERTALIALLEDLPDYCCLVLVYEQVDYKINKVYKKLCGALEAHVQTVRFDMQGRDDMIHWLGRRFGAYHKEIDTKTAEHLLFTCGGLMTGLIPEIEKISAYAKGPSITVADINAVSEPILDAVVFDISRAITKGDYDYAAERLGQLLRKQEEPIMLLAVMAKELRRIYTARIALDSGKDKRWLMELWGMKSDYPAKLLLSAARQVDREWCRTGLTLCRDLDRRLKSERGIDPEGELKLLLAKLAGRNRG